MFWKRFRVATLFGFPFYLDLSWFVIAALFVWSLAVDVFPRRLPGQGAETYWLMGSIGAVGLFASVVLHELGHAFVARRFGLPIRGITLFIFGGVAEMEREPPSARAEFWVAVAGPVVSLALALLGGVAAGGLAAGTPTRTVVSYLASTNLALLLFNMIPAFPLDGGRILRSALWKWKRNLSWATRVTSGIGSGFGFLLMAGGVLLATLGKNLTGGIWLLLIGMFLRNAAQMSYRGLVVRRAIEGEPVRRFMRPDPVTVPRSISVAELVEDYVYRHHFKMFPVVDNERLVGCVTTRGIRQLPREEWQQQSVSSILEPCTDGNTVHPDSDALRALGKMHHSGVSRLLVVEDGRLVGILTLKDLLQFLSLKVELEGRRHERAATRPMSS
ncbi:MAG: site-2 protease family protein [Thermoanaerobaculia bacterium]